MIIRGFRKEKAVRRLKKVLPLLLFINDQVQIYQQKMLADTSDKPFDFADLVLFLQLMYRHTEAFGKQNEVNGTYLPKDIRDNFRKINGILVCLDFMNELRTVPKGGLPTAANINLGNKHIWPDTWVKSVEYIQKNEQDMATNHLEVYRRHAKIIVDNYVPIISLITDLAKKMESHT